MGIVSCSPRQVTVPGEKMVMTEEIAERLIKLPLKCMQNEYPNKPNQVLTEAHELGTPQELHPAFYGCFDWHSSVHGHWMSVRLLRLFPGLSDADTIKSILSENLTADNLALEVEYFKRPGETSFERTYGWAWLLKLDEELFLWKDSMAEELRNNMKPLTDLISERFMDFLPRLNHPIRTGEHPNTAFGLSLAYDYAVSVNNDKLIELIKSRAREYYFNDYDCPLSWEPGGYDFLSPCLQEADLMSKVLPPEEFKAWLDHFLPLIKNDDFAMAPARVSDRTDGKLVHLDGLNFCRAWSLFHIAKNLPDYNHLIDLGNKHIKASLDDITDGSYEGEHWLASFAVLALTSD